MITSSNVAFDLRHTNMHCMAKRDFATELNAKKGTRETLRVGAVYDATDGHTDVSILTLLQMMRPTIRLPQFLLQELFQHG
jgi:hypothetical protein